MPKVPSTRWYVGVDPGASGGIALIGGVGQVRLWKMPETDKDVLELLDYYCNAADGAALEKVQGYIGQGQPGSAMFKFGMSYGRLRMALTAAKLPFEEVTPQRWQKELNIPKRGKTETKTQFKNRLRAKAQQLYPDAQITLATADALLIATWCMRRAEGKL